ncbi:MAG: class I SAM-dependent methyltransferase [Planctomycetota bacterium]
MPAELRRTLKRILPAALHAPARRAHQVLRAVLVLARHPTWARFALPWLLSLRSGRNALCDEVPWMTYRAREWLADHLAPSMKVFEWGSGGSTVFISRRVEQLVAVEHSPLWEARVAERLRSRSIANCQLLLIECGDLRADSDGDECGDVSRFASLWFGDDRRTCEQYVRAIDPYPDGSFDLVSVDGHARLACISRAIPKVRPGGHIMLDNSERYREEASGVLEGWESVDLSGPGPYHPYAWEAVVWRRPAPPGGP